MVIMTAAVSTLVSRVPWIWAGTTGSGCPESWETCQFTRPLKVKIAHGQTVAMTYRHIPMSALTVCQRWWLQENPCMKHTICFRYPSHMHMEEQTTNYNSKSCVHFSIEKIQTFKGPHFLFNLQSDSFVRLSGTNEGNRVVLGERRLDGSIWLDGKQQGWLSG